MPCLRKLASFSQNALTSMLQRGLILEGPEVMLGREQSTVQCVLRSASFSVSPFNDLMKCFPNLLAPQGDGTCTLHPFRTFAFHEPHKPLLAQLSTVSISRLWDNFSFYILSFVPCLECPVRQTKEAMT